jgi:DNA-binding response OmpR family regulator
MRLKILVVDGDGDARSLAARALDTAGHDTQEADSGQRALTLMGRGEPDLLILEATLPDGDMDGFDLCRAVRRHSELPVLFLTVRRDPVDELVGLTVGGDVWLTKPVAPRLIVAHTEALARRALRSGHQNGYGSVNGNGHGNGSDDGHGVGSLTGMAAEDEASPPLVHGDLEIDREARAAGEPQARAWSLLEGDDGDQHDEQVRHEAASRGHRQHRHLQQQRRQDQGGDRKSVV